MKSKANPICFIGKKTLIQPIGPLGKLYQDLLISNKTREESINQKEGFGRKEDWSLFNPGDGAGGEVEVGRLPNQPLAAANKELRDFTSLIFFSSGSQ